MPVPQMPKPPQPRSDVPAPKGMSDADYRRILTELGQSTPDVWRGTDGTLYLWRMPASMLPGGDLADTPGIIAPDSPSYAEHAARLLPQYDYQGMEVPSAQGADSHAQGG